MGSSVDQIKEINNNETAHSNRGFIRSAFLGMALAAVVGYGIGFHRGNKYGLDTPRRLAEEKRVEEVSKQLEPLRESFIKATEESCSGFGDGISCDGRIEAIVNERNNYVTRNGCEFEGEWVAHEHASNWDGPYATIIDKIRCPNPTRPFEPLVHTSSVYKLKKFKATELRRLGSTHVEVEVGDYDTRKEAMEAFKSRAKMWEKFRRQEKSVSGLCPYQFVVYDQYGRIVFAQDTGVALR